MVSSLGLACFSLYMGLTKMWKAMAANAQISGNDFRPSAVQFVTQYLWPSIVEIIKHERFKECGENDNRVTGHLPLMLAFIALFIVTIWSLVKNDILGLFIPSLIGPMVIYDPFKILANVAAVALLFGIFVLWSNRTKSEAEGKATRTFYDWFLIWEIAAVGITGLGAEILRWLNIPVLGYPMYYLHLVSVMMLFLYLPYTKLAHIAFRTTAMAFEKYRESSFAKPIIEK